MSIPLFPTLAGIGWSTFKRPTHSTAVSTHLSGDEVRITGQSYPTYEFELSYPDYLPDSASVTSDLKILMGFYLQQQGRLGTFRYTDPSDCSATGQTLGVADGTTTTFTFLRALGGWTEPIGYVESVSKISIGGVAQSGWTVADSSTGHNSLVFAGAPGGGVIAADFTFSFLCRFVDDQVEFEQHMKNMWLMKSLKFKSVKRP